MNRRGFTLLELMISLAILSTLVVLTARSIQQAVKSKAQISTRVDQMSRVRDALRVMERDINMAFHYRDLDKEIDEIIQKNHAASQQGRGAAGDQLGGPNNQSRTPPGFRTGRRQAPPQFDQEEEAAGMTWNRISERVNRVDPTTFFSGESEILQFVSSGQGRTVANARRSDLAEITYFVDSCPNVGRRSGQGSCLMRRSFAYFGPDPSEEGRAIALLENITEFSLRYFGEGKQDWVNEWRTGPQGDAVTSQRFPSAVEVSLTIEPGEGEARRSISMQMVVPIRFTNNPPFEREDTGFVPPPTM